MDAPVEAVVGLPLYDSDPTLLRDTLDSLLGLDHPAFAIVAVDDSMSDEPGQIVRDRASRDRRLDYERNPSRLGLVDNWRKAFALARRHHPQARYFAWAGDHDLWEPSWLSALAAELDAHPEAVLAYPLSDTISASGDRIAEPWQFDTGGGGRATRFARVLRRMVAGDMVYGLARTDALARCGPMRDVLFPDRLLLAELSLQGDFRQVRRLLWHRRKLCTATPGFAARRRALFAGRAPLSARVFPWWLAHAGVLATALAVRGEARPAIGRAGGAVAASAYLGLVPALHLARRAYYAAGLARERQQAEPPPSRERAS